MTGAVHPMAVDTLDAAEGVRPFSEGLLKSPQQVVAVAVEKDWRRGMMAMVEEEEGWKDGQRQTTG